ncbi:haloacid dehalogenase-like hydrolase domain-containing 3 [Micractinium conductrix]|uniref:Haloacid dehalogenase-like hydrolase domain-containing 3 n=1 Tax=Micractinium conductrix TaxID=554055 RepID=A0A2P6VIK2_9CHLO|nr:haloacid dehalogenase-like hydrolase domain-containing 3 [Micractinium conductrix]|eukprot:PSC73910.1 haloacid dehalogenase-like hydrolase domain-containing 3 [Micractinium conductrix]
MLASRVGGFSQLLLSSLAPSATLTAATRVLDSAAALTSGPSCRSFAAAEPVWDPLWRQTEPLLQPTNLREFQPRFKGLLVDAAGTLLSPSEPAAEVYLRYARKYGCDLSPLEVLQRFRAAYNTPWGQSTIRYVGDGRPFWRHIVFQSTGCCSDEMFEELYDHYARGDSYKVAPGAIEALRRIRDAGYKTAVVSNFDTRLWRILADLRLSDLFDAVVVSAEVQAEKPNPVIFEAACAALGLPPEQCVHVGDDRRNDLYGARDSGCFAWLWGQDVFTFAEVERRLATRNYFDSLTEAP